MKLQSKAKITSLSQQLEEAKKKTTDSADRVRIIYIFVFIFLIVSLYDMLMSEDKCF